MSIRSKIIVLIILVISSAGALYGGYRVGAASVPSGSLYASEGLDADVDFSLFWESVDFIKGNYFKADELEEKDILYGAIRGVVQELDDPYSSFFEPVDAQKFGEDIRGEFGGVGMEISIRDGNLIVLAPLKGSPAEEVGLKSGDRILKVDDVFTDSITIDGAVKIIRGEIGTEVILTILREGWEEDREFTIVRQTIQIPTLDWKMVGSDDPNGDDGKIAYIQLYSFNANAPSLFYKASFETLLRGAKGVILDLRNNSGGFLDVSITIAGWFLERGELVVQEKFSSGKTKEFYADGNGAWRETPVVILVNGGSASASEILAGALRDQVNATLVGEKTFGKGTVQEVVNLDDGSKLKISVAEWITAKGGIINEVGLDPDVEVKFTDEDIEAGRDPQFEAALELIKEKTKNIKSIQTILL